MTDPVDFHAHMVKLISGYQVSQVVRAVADLSIADHLVEGPLTANEIAKREGAIADYTFRLMRAAVAVGLLDADNYGRFHTTPLLNTLRKDAPRSLHGLVMAGTARSFWLSWQAMVEAIRTGANPAQCALGCDVLTYLDHNPDQSREFRDGMRAMTSAWAPYVAQLIDTRSVSLAVDVGGSDGSLLFQLQRANRALHGIVFERPGVAAEVRDRVSRGEFGDRTEVIAGDFFEGLPAGDLYLLKMILQAFDSSRCIEILQRCRDAMNPGGRVVIVEQFVGPDRNPGISAALSDLNMLVLTQGGRERTLSQFDALLEAAGLRRTMVFTTKSPHSVIEAVPET